MIWFPYAYIFIYLSAERELSGAGGRGDVTAGSPQFSKNKERKKKTVKQQNPAPHSVTTDSEELTHSFQSEHDWNRAVGKPMQCHISSSSLSNRPDRKPNTKSSICAYLQVLLFCITSALW